MNATIRNTLAFVAGVVALTVAKYVAEKLGSAVIPPPAGADLSTIEGFTAALPPLPIWVVVVDLAAMYLPMAWIGGRLGSRTQDGP